MAAAAAARALGASEREASLRAYGARLALEACLLLRLPHAAAVTACVLFQALVDRRPAPADRPLVPAADERVAACVWLAAKLEEAPRPARSVVSVFERLRQRRASACKPVPLDYSTVEYDRLRAALVRTERMLLDEFGFMVVRGVRARARVRACVRARVRACMRASRPVPSLFL